MKPTCYNRPAWVSVVRSQQFFGLDYPFRMTAGCPHWAEGGNARVRPRGDDKNGVKFDWRECDGCKWKTTTGEQQ